LFIPDRFITADFKHYKGEVVLERIEKKSPITPVTDLFFRELVVAQVVKLYAFFFFLKISSFKRETASYPEAVAHPQISFV
jgi:hypothetical protein